MKMQKVKETIASRPYFRNIIRERQKNNMKRCLPAEPRRIIGEKGAKPLRSRRLTEESYQISHWETGKAWYDNDTGARRPALHKGSMLRMFPASVTSDDRVRKAGLLRAENTDLHFIPVFVCIYAAKSGIFLTGETFLPSLSVEPVPASLSCWA